jgi:hypothetical protein
LEDHDQIASADHFADRQQRCPEAIFAGVSTVQLRDHDGWGRLRQVDRAQALPR